MIKTDKVRRDAQSNLAIRLPDTFVCGTSIKVNDPVDIYFGANSDTIIITTHDKNLSRDNKERIRILTDIKD